MRVILVFAALAVFAAEAAGAPPRLGLPLVCKPGENCWILNYYDHDPGPGRRDHTCGAMTYDGHQGIDFAIRDLAVMASGVPVIASVDGLVVAARDGVQDVSVREIGLQAVAGRECGNGIRISHEDGWQTQYCHLRQGSVRVAPGQRIVRGAVLGMVGMSGKAEFPHVELKVLRRGEAIDPFTGGSQPSCGSGPAGDPDQTAALSLWSPDALDQLTYSGGAIVNAGITDAEPDAAGIARGDHRPERVGREADMLLLWAQAYGISPGDRISLQLRDPAGRVVAAHGETADRARIVRSLYVGGRKPPSGWRPGTYVGDVEIVRSRDQKVSRSQQVISVE